MVWEFRLSDTEGHKFSFSAARLSENIRYPNLIDHIPPGSPDVNSPGRSIRPNKGAAWRSATHQPALLSENCHQGIHQPQKPSVSQTPRLRCVTDIDMLLGHVEPFLIP
jgi:hypothetical protein